MCVHQIEYINFTIYIYVHIYGAVMHKEKALKLQFTSETKRLFEKEKKKKKKKKATCIYGLHLVKSTHNMYSAS